MAAMTPPLPAVSRPSTTTSSRLPVCCSQRDDAVELQLQGLSRSSVVGLAQTTDSSLPPDFPPFTCPCLKSSVHAYSPGRQRAKADGASALWARSADVAADRHGGIVELFG